MDFRGPDIGNFVFHCHILEHEGGGMMNIIQVVPVTAKSQIKKHCPREAEAGRLSACG
jgi:hypothetical protein